MKMIYKNSPQATQLAALKFMADTLKLKPQNQPHLDGFAAACFDDNYISELVEALRERAADSTDCENWEITPTEWRNAIREALEQRIFDAITDIEA